MSANDGQQRGQVVTGARGYLVWDGQPVAYATRVSFRLTARKAPINCLDDLEVTEHVTTAYEVENLRATIVETVDRNLIAMGIQPEQDNLLVGRTFTLEIKDRPSDTAQYVHEGVQWESMDMSVQKGTPTETELGFVARRCRVNDGRV